MPADTIVNISHMTSLANQLPRSASGPLSLASLAVGVLGLTLGFVFAMVGLMLLLGLAPAEPKTTTDAVIVFGLGAAVLVLGYAGLKGFMRFAY